MGRYAELAGRDPDPSLNESPALVLNHASRLGYLMLAILVRAGQGSHQVRGTLAQLIMSTLICSDQIFVALHASTPANVSLSIPLQSTSGAGSGSK